MCGLSPRTVHSRRRPRQSASARSVWIRTRSQRGSRPSGCSRPAKCLCEAEAGEQLPAAAPRTAPKAENRFHHSQKVQLGAPKGEYLRAFCFSPPLSPYCRRLWVSLLRPGLRVRCCAVVCRHHVRQGRAASRAFTVFEAATATAPWADAVGSAFQARTEPTNTRAPLIDPVTCTTTSCL